MKTKTYPFPILDSSNTLFHIRGKGEPINFTKGHLSVDIYYNNSNSPRQPDTAQSIIARKNQPQTDCFEIEIPKNAKSATVILHSNDNHYDLNQVEVLVVSNQ
jgi:hypothetical protein